MYQESIIGTTFEPSYEVYIHCNTVGTPPWPCAGVTLHWIETICALGFKMCTKYCTAKMQRSLRSSGKDDHCAKNLQIWGTLFIYQTNSIDDVVTRLKVYHGGWRWGWNSRYLGYLTKTETFHWFTFFCGKPLIIWPAKMLSPAWIIFDAQIWLGRELLLDQCLAY